MFVLHFKRHLRTGYSFKVLEGVESTWKELMDCKENYRSQLEDYLLGKDLPHVLKELSGCRMDHEVLENFKEESNVAYIESGDLKQVKCYGCNKEFKRKKSNAFVTISTKNLGILV